MILTRPYADTWTVYDVLKRSYSLYGNKPAQGSRPLLRWQTDDGFKFPAKVFKLVVHR